MEYFCQPLGFFPHTQHLQNHSNTTRLLFFKYALNSALRDGHITENSWTILTVAMLQHRNLTLTKYLGCIKKSGLNIQIINGSTKYSMFRPKISVCVLTLTNSTVKLFAATSARQECSETVAHTVGRSERRKFTGSYSLPSKSVCFPPRDSRAKQRLQCLGSALPLWRAFKGCCCLTDGHCLGWESREGHSVCLCEFLSIHLCPIWALPKHPSSSYWQFLFLCQICLSFQEGFPLMFLKENSCQQPELSLNVIIFEHHCCAFWYMIKLYIFLSCNLSSVTGLFQSNVT